MENEQVGRAREVVDQVKERASERIDSRLTDTTSRAAETLSSVASTLHSSSQQLRDQNQERASRAIERAAEGVERFASYIQDTNVDDVVDSVHEFARRQPAAFIGGAFALGFIASRFIKATSPHGSRRPLSDTGRNYSTSYNTTRSYEGSSNINRGAGYGNTGDTSGSLGYGAGLSTGAGGTTGGGYTTGDGAGSGYGASGSRTATTGAARNSNDLGDGSPGVNRTGGSDAGSR